MHAEYSRVPDTIPDPLSRQNGLGKFDHVKPHNGDIIIWFGISSKRLIFDKFIARLYAHPMSARKILFLLLFLLQTLGATPLAEQFKQAGYVEICEKKQDADVFESLYASFDKLIDFLQTNRAWQQKLYGAKERFIRSKDRQFYSTDFFGLYDESEVVGRSQISFYYSVHFHAFISSNYPEFKKVPEIIGFFEACQEIQKPYGALFEGAAAELGIEISNFGLLLKVIKYLPSYLATKPHYDGTAFSLFLDSTDNQSLLLSPYKPSYTVGDFSSPAREFSQGILLIPGALLAEFAIDPTPHIVLSSGKVRYSTILFGMRPNYTPEQIATSPLPSFRD